MVDTDLQRQKFRGRLKRIKSGGPNTLGQVYIGPHDELGGPEASKPHFGIPATIFCFILGAVAYLLGSLGQFHLLSEDGVYTTAQFGDSGAALMAWSGDLALAAVALLVLIKLTRRRGFGPYLVGAIGISAMLVGQPLAVGVKPELFTALYSEHYVARVLRTQG